MTSILAPLEVFRRFVWNFFRLENEHLNNCGKFRAVRDISVVPLESSDQTTILRMMDEPDGVVNRYSKQNKPKHKKTKDPEKKSLIPPLYKSHHHHHKTHGGVHEMEIIDISPDGLWESFFIQIFVKIVSNKTHFKIYVIGVSRKRFLNKFKILLNLLVSTQHTSIAFYRQLVIIVLPLEIIRIEWLTGF